MALASTCRSWRDYHESTKHTPGKLRREPHGLDWAHLPDPFRHYEGVPVLDLPTDPPGPSDGPAFLSQLLYHSAAISATKLVPSTGYRYALRVNPSSGNLHPTEFHFRTRGLVAWPDGLYHYRPSSHMAEQRALGSFDAADSSASPIVFFLTSIAWREAWKYRERAYRYCLHDIGHAWQALASAARAMGCEAIAQGHFPDEELAGVCRFHEDEWPMLKVELRGAPIPIRVPDHRETVWYGGHANTLSTGIIAYAPIGDIHNATGVGTLALPEPAATGSGAIDLPAPQPSARAFWEIARQRRSALDFIGGDRPLSLAQLSALLTAAAQPLSADFSGARFIQLYLYIHRIAGLAPGVYRYWPAPHQLGLLEPGDQRLAAAGLSLGQDLAGNSCVTFSMIADLDRATRAFGERAYRYVHFEAGAIGQHLYLAAESLGLGATGIGAFYDDEVHRYLGLSSDGGQQVVYHFAIGYPVYDPRLEA